MGLHEERLRVIADTLAMIRRLADDAGERMRHNRSEQDRQHDMDARLRAFRNRQRFEQIEREVHYQQAMQRIDAATQQWT